jgi:hypothetical protein
VDKEKCERCGDTDDVVDGLCCDCRDDDEQEEDNKRRKRVFNTIISTIGM